MFWLRADLSWRRDYESVSEAETRASSVLFVMCKCSRTYSSLLQYERESTSSDVEKIQQRRNESSLSPRGVQYADKNNREREREKIKRVENIQTNENKQTKETEEQFLYLHGRERFARQNPNARGSSHERRLLRFPRGAQ